jgi:beta-lactamase class A
LLLCLALLFPRIATSTEIKPEGFGASSEGGAGGKVITITTLADDGPGSFREALANKEPRIIRFGVEGTIELRQPVVARHGRVTIDGTTLSGNSITIAKYGVWFLDESSDIILHNLRLRPTEGRASGDGLLFNGQNERVLIDHCSVMWATDENIDTWGRVKDLTCQWTIIAEGQRHGDHQKGKHSMGWLCGRRNDRFTIHHCLFAHNADRSPLLSGGTFDLVNNVVYNWAGGSNAVKLLDGARANVVGCSILSGPESGGGGVIYLNRGEPAAEVFVSANVTPFAKTGNEDPRLSVQAGSVFPAPESQIEKKPFEAPAVTTQTASEALELVLKKAGPLRRDADEKRVVQEVRDRSGHVGRRNEDVNVADRLHGRFPKDELNAVAKKFAGRIGFFVRDLASGADYGWNSDERFPPASVIKLPVMIELYRQAADGRLDLDKRLRLPDDISTHGTGVLKKKEPPVELLIHEYANLMMIHSDNMATDFIIRTVSTKATNQFLDVQGFRNTRVSLELGRWHYIVCGIPEQPITLENDARLIDQIKAGRMDNAGLGYSGSLKNNVCAPRETVLLLERLYRGQLTSEKHKQAILEPMRASTHKDTIARHVKAGIKVANKYGGSQRIAADAGIVEIPGRPIAIACFALAKDQADRSGRDILAEMCRLAIKALAPDAVKSGTNNLKR